MHVSLHFALATADPPVVVPGPHTTWHRSQMSLQPCPHSGVQAGLPMHKTSCSHAALQSLCELEHPANVPTRTTTPSRP
jgi:hypothetical protein